jgi:cob(I)alamin adenosyltransferase
MKTKKSNTEIETLAEIDSLNVKFNLHEYHCEKNRTEVLASIARLENFLFLSSGATILFLAGILFTIII